MQNQENDKIPTQTDGKPEEENLTSATETAEKKPAAKKSSATKSSSTAKKPAAKSASTKSTAAKKPAVKKAAEKAPEAMEEAAPETAEVKVEEAASVTEEVKAEEAALAIEASEAEEVESVTEPAEEVVEESEPVQEAVISEVAVTEDNQPEQTATEPVEETSEKAVEGEDVGEAVTAEQLNAQIAAGDFSHFDDAAERAKEQSEMDAKMEEDKLLPPDPEAILEVRHLKKHFVLKKTITGKPLSTLKAVDDVSFKIMPGETLGIVGESGCGKTTMGRTVLKLHQPTSGQVFFEGEDIAKYKPRQMRPLRTKMQIVFQDPYSSLPPRSTVGGILAEAVKVHKIVPKEQIKDYVLDVMDKCGLRDYYYERYPHEFSGGQRQRICIARALVLNPKLVVCDEPVSALDVSIQAQIINLLKKLQQERGLTYLFISHDLSVVKYISDKIGVMYLGSMVEFGEKDKIFNNPMHPYTVALFSAVPNPNPDEKTERIILKGDIPSPANPPMGCKFHTRCPKAMEICKHVAPVYKEYEEGHFVACHCYPQED